MAIIPFARLPHSVMCAPCAPATLISLAVIRIDKELSISNSTNIGEVSGEGYTGGVVGLLDNVIDSGGTKIYSHNIVFNIVNCGNMENIKGSGYVGGVVGAIGEDGPDKLKMSYAGIVSQAIANTITNQITFKYCFNTASVSGAGTKGGIVNRIYNCVGSTTGRGGKIDLDFSYNLNTGHISNTGTSGAGGMVLRLTGEIYSDNSYCNMTISNNFNTGSINSGGTTGTNGVSGIVSYFTVIDSTTKPNNVKITVSSCYNYSIDLNGGNKNIIGGMVGRFVNNCSRVNLLNNYSAYKREDDNNVHGQNTADPTTIGANVGGVEGGATAPFVVSYTMVIIQIV